MSLRNATHKSETPSCMSCSCNYGAWSRFSLSNSQEGGLKQHNFTLKKDPVVKDRSVQPIENNASAVKLCGESAVLYQHTESLFVYSEFIEASDS